MKNLYFKLKINSISIIFNFFPFIFTFILFNLKEKNIFIILLLNKLSLKIKFQIKIIHKFIYNKQSTIIIYRLFNNFFNNKSILKNFDF
jgi:hypothetical protein